MSTAEIVITWPGFRDILPAGFVRKGTECQVDDVFRWYATKCGRSSKNALCHRNSVFNVAHSSGMHACKEQVGWKMLVVLLVFCYHRARGLQTVFNAKHSIWRKQGVKHQYRIIELPGSLLTWPPVHKSALAGPRTGPALPRPHHDS